MWSIVCGLLFGKVLVKNLAIKNINKEIRHVWLFIYEEIHLNIYEEENEEWEVFDLEFAFVKRDWYRYRREINRVMKTQTESLKSNGQDKNSGI